MSLLRHPFELFALMGLALLAVGMFQSPSLALNILNLCLISAIMALGVNMQWGYAGLFNAGVMGFAALGGVAAMLVSMPPVAEAVQAGGLSILAAGAALVAGVAAAIWVHGQIGGGGVAKLAALVVFALGYAAARLLFDPAADAIEAINPAKTGYMGGLGLPIVLGWAVGGVLAAGAAWIVAKVALGLRSDYLAIATLGISEIIVAMLKNEDWLTRGVKNVNGLPRPVPYEVDLQEAGWFQVRAAEWGIDPVELSSITVKLAYAGLFILVLVALLWLAERALNSPWGRMMRAIRDNETAAEAMGKDVTARHAQVFILGSAVIGIAGAMLVTLDGQFTPTTYQPLRFTFLIWVMVIVGGSGSNYGAVLGGFLVWFAWVEAEPVGHWLMGLITAGLPEGSALREHLLDSAAHMRLITMGLILLLALRFSPRGLIPERSARRA